MIGNLQIDANTEAAAEKRFRMILKEGANNLMSFELVKPELPSFYDENKFLLGQRALQKNIFSMMIAKLCGLVILLTVRTILDVIMFTKKSSSACLAYRRYASTILHTLVWHEKIPSKDNEFFESLKIVRKKHCVAFKRSTEAGIAKPSQLDMALSQFGFMGLIILSGDNLGMSVTYEELEGVVHLWRVIGNMLGMDDKFNLCTGTVEETAALCQIILEEVFLPSLTKKNEHFDEMTRILLESLWPVNTSIDPQGFTAFTCHLISASVRNNNQSIKIDTANMSFHTWYVYNLKLFVLTYLMRPGAWWTPFFRAIFNGLMRLSFFCMRNFPFLAIWLFGEKYARVHIFSSHSD